MTAKIDPRDHQVGQQLDTRRCDWRGARDAAETLPAIVPLGIALGAALADTGAPQWASWLTAPLRFAGAAQLALVAQLAGGAPTSGGLPMAAASSPLATSLTIRRRHSSLAAMVAGLGLYALIDRI